MANHTPEPWSFVPIDSFAGYGKVLDANGTELMKNIPYGESAPSNETMKRIVACVNACAGIPDDLLQYYDKNIINRYTQHLRNETFRKADLLATVTAQRDELAGIIMELRQFSAIATKEMTTSVGDYVELFERAVAAIARCEVKNDE